MPRHRNLGIRKLCSCSRRAWIKCRHSWYFSFKDAGVHHRFSLDRHFGRHISSRTAAEDLAERLQVAIKDGTFAEPVTHPPPQPEPELETVESYARAWLQVADLNLKASTVSFYADNLESHVFPAFGQRPITEVSRKDCRDTLQKKSEPDWVREGQLAFLLGKSGEPPRNRTGNLQIKSRKQDRK